MLHAPGRVLARGLPQWPDTTMSTMPGDDVRTVLDNAQPSLDGEWLRHFHASYTERFLSDNQRIWTTASILVPVALAAFPAFFATDGRGTLKAAIFGGFSILVMAFWHVIAERHRYYQKRAYNVVSGIEAHILGGDIAQKIRGAASVNAQPPRLTTRAARIGLLGGTFALWLIIAILAWKGLLPEPQSSRS